MNRRLFGAFGVLAIAAAASVGGCKNDPLSDQDGVPAQLVTSFNHLNINVGTSSTVTASVLDARATPLEIPVTFTACNNAITAGTDSSYHPIPATSSRGLITANVPSPSCIVVTAAGLTDTVTVSALPPTFPGALSSTTPKGGDTLTINSTAQLKFDTAAVAVTFGGGHAAVIVSKSADVLKVLVPFSTAAPLTIDGIVVTTYTPPLPVSLSTDSVVTQTGDVWGTGDPAYASAPTIPVPAAATSETIVTNFGPANGPNCAEFGPPSPNNSIGPCVIYKFTLAAPTQLTFSTAWPTAGDMDTYVCDASGLAGCFESGGSGAGSNNPEVISAFTYAAGTHYFVIEQFRGPQPDNLVVTITRP